MIIVYSYNNREQKKQEDIYLTFDNYDQNYCWTTHIKDDHDLYTIRVPTRLIGRILFKRLVFQSSVVYEAFSFVRRSPDLAKIVIRHENMFDF